MKKFRDFLTKFVYTTILLLSLSCNVTFADSKPAINQDDLIELKGYRIFVLDGPAAERINDDCNCDVIINIQDGVIILLKLAPRTSF